MHTLFDAGFQKIALDPKMITNLMTGRRVISNAPKFESEAGKLARSAFFKEHFPSRRHLKMARKIIRDNRTYLNKTLGHTKGRKLKLRDAEIASNFATVIENTPDPVLKQKTVDRLANWMKSKGIKNVNPATSGINPANRVNITPSITRKWVNRAGRPLSNTQNVLMDLAFS